MMTGGRKPPDFCGSSKKKGCLGEKSGARVVNYQGRLRVSEHQERVGECCPRQMRIPASDLLTMRSDKALDKEGIGQESGGGVH